MNIGALFFIFYAQWSFNSILFVESAVSKKDYKDFLKAIVNHIRGQRGWYDTYDTEIYFAGCDTLTIGTVMVQKLRPSNYTNTFNAIVNLINYRYEDVLQRFLKTIAILVEECDSNNYFVDCTISLEDELKNSLTMLENLYSVVTFLSYLDLKYAANVVPSNSSYIIELIYNTITFIKNMPLSNQVNRPDRSDVYYNAKMTITNLTEFLENLPENLPPYSTVLVTQPKSVDLKLMYLDDFRTEQHNFTEFSYYVCHRLRKYYESVIVDQYENLGFDAFSQNIVPPLIDGEINQGLAVQTMNTLLQNGNWESVQHISFFHQDQMISANFVVRDPTDHYNFHLKKEFFLQLLKCRFIELLSNYGTYLSASTYMCIQEKQRRNIDGYVQCAWIFFDAVKRSKIFLDTVLRTIDVLNDSEIHPTAKKNSFTIIKQVVKNIIAGMYEEELMRRDLVFDALVDPEWVSDEFLKSIKKIKDPFNAAMIDMRPPRSRNCIIPEENYLISKELVKTIRRKVLFSKQNNDSTNVCEIDYQQACAELIELCRNFTNVEYENLGFNRIPTNQTGISANNP